MKYGLSSATILKLQQLFSKFDAIEEVILYGSRAKGNHQEGSDIDLTIKGKDFDALFLPTMLNEIDDLLLPYKVDVSIYGYLTNKELIDHIERVGKIFYSKTANIQSHLTR